MFQKKNTVLGKINLIFFIILFLSHFKPVFGNQVNLFTEIKILDKISSKNTLLKLKNKDEIKFKDLIIKSIKCKNSEFDDDPEITAYMQVKDITRMNNDEVFVFNGWMFSSSPSINPFDHPVYDIWLTKCY